MPRRYGQHFLADPRIVDRILETAEVGPDDVVLEIGPGEGVLTRPLAERAKRVVSVEIDRSLHAALASSDLPENVELIRGNVLELSDAELKDRLGTCWQIVSNLPYEITSDVLRRFLSGPYRPFRLTLMLQKEVGERLAARAGGMNRLAVFAGYRAAVRYGFTVPSEAFSPPPKVASCIVRLDLRPVPPLDPRREALLFKMSEAAFAAPRRQIGNTLAPFLGTDPGARLAAANLRPAARPEEILLEQWITLASGM